MSTTGRDPGGHGPDRTAQSGGGWSEMPTLPGDEAGAPSEGARGDATHPFRLSPKARYETIEVAGRGGMGEVVVARDRRLGREVALKRIHAGGDDSLLAKRLAREAWVTARLEHPSIVPLYDAGTGEDGRLFYTMRLIHGRSLADTLHDAPGLPQRLAVLRHFLAVCDAVAYAHNHGIVHRDLKPANIMVGSFGETQLVDWGLAGFFDQRTARRFIARGGDATASFDPTMAVELTQPGALGTPAYMSPEQASGEQAGARGDVWALGAILHEIVTGERLLGEVSAGEALSRLRARQLDRQRLSRSGAPGELRAIVEKATAIEPAERYADAGEMAADLTRYLDGAQVHAHAYSTWELVGRLARRLRLPLFVAGSALLAATIALTATFRRINAERHRAQTAEQSARAAADESRGTTAWALARQSVTELEQGAIPEADLLAAHALLREESPDARGVVAATWASPRTITSQARDLPGCTRVVPGNWDVALCEDNDAVSLWDLDPPRLRWRHEHFVWRAYLTTDSSGRALVHVLSGAKDLIVLDGATGEVTQRHHVDITSGLIDRFAATHEGDYLAVSDSRALWTVSLAERRIQPTLRPCGTSPIPALSGTNGGFVVVCGDGRVVRVDARALALQTLATVADLVKLTPSSAALSSDGAMLAVGGIRGDLALVDLAIGKIVKQVRAGDVGVQPVGFVGGSRSLVVAASGHRGIALWDLPAGIELIRLPAVAGARFFADARGLVTGGRFAARWTLPTTMAPRQLTAPAGLAGLSASADGLRIAVARGDGHAEVWDGATGHQLADVLLAQGVVKTVDFSPDGKLLAASVSAAGATPVLLDVGSWIPRPAPGLTRNARRMGFTATGELLALNFAPPLSLAAPDGTSLPLAIPEMLDLAWTLDRREHVMLSVDGTAWRLRGHELREVFGFPGGIAIASWPHGPRIAIASEDAVALIEGGGADGALPPAHLARTIRNTSSRLCDLAVSPDERYLAGGRVDGTIAVWSLADLHLVATLRGHRDRIGQLIFTANGELLSAGWDGRVLRWNLSVLDMPAAELVTRAEATWPGGLRLAVDARVP